ncbi:hypothetical protein B296_00053703 [Ensete ventricosum]|uniref:Uncharacterized protein n=1 Tax=Ensete ventricosum TaxID=4639 RepID=A0A426Y6X0_ENSVE|nr:hypothetical protein B296_00053703 [Ensete ventricosum]
MRWCTATRSLQRAQRLQATPALPKPQLGSAPPTQRSFACPRHRLCSLLPGSQKSGFCLRVGPSGRYGTSCHSLYTIIGEPPMIGHCEGASRIPPPIRFSPTTEPITAPFSARIVKPKLDIRHRLAAPVRDSQLTSPHLNTRKLVTKLHL